MTKTTSQENSVKCHLSPPFYLFGVRSQSLIQNESLEVAFDFLSAPPCLHGIAKICSFKLLELPHIHPVPPY